MNSDRWSIQRAEGGFIVEVAVSPDDREADVVGPGFSFKQMVFTDSAKLLNFLHNELVGSN